MSVWLVYGRIWTSAEETEYHSNMTRLDATQANIQLAEMSLGPQLAPGRWRKPEVIESDGKTLHWRWFDAAPVPFLSAALDAFRVFNVRLGPHYELAERSTNEILERFVSLAETELTSAAREARILRFAKRWGVLEICEHDLPACHNPPHAFFFEPAQANQEIHYCQARQPEDRSWDGYETIQNWHEYAQRAKATLNIAASLHRGLRATEADWSTIWKYPNPPHDRALPEQRRSLAAIVRQWLGVAKVQLDLRLQDDQEPSLRFWEGSLFGALTLRLVAAVSRTDGLAICSGCTAAYIPERRPRGDRRNYCRECRRRGVPQRDAQRSHRERKRPRRHK